MAPKYDKEVEEIIGEEAWDLLIKQVTEYNIEKKHLDDISSKLNVGGPHRMRMDKGADSDDVEWRMILSDW